MFQVIFLVTSHFLYKDNQFCDTVKEEESESRYQMQDNSVIIEGKVCIRTSVLSTLILYYNIDQLFLQILETLKNFVPSIILNYLPIVSFPLIGPFKEAFSKGCRNRKISLKPLFLWTFGLPFGSTTK